MKEKSKLVKFQIQKVTSLMVLHIIYIMIELELTSGHVTGASGGQQLGPSQLSYGHLYTSQPALATDTVSTKMIAEIGAFMALRQVFFSTHFDKVLRVTSTGTGMIGISEFGGSPPYSIINRSLESSFGVSYK